MGLKNLDKNTAVSIHRGMSLRHLRTLSSPSRLVSMRVREVGGCRRFLADVTRIQAVLEGQEKSHVFRQSALCILRGWSKH